MHRLILRLFAGLLLVAACALLLLPVPRSSLPIWPVAGAKVATYSDADEGGLSSVKLDSLPGRLRFEWAIAEREEGASFVGLLFDAPQGCFWDLSRFDSLEMDWESDAGVALRVILLVDEPGYTRPGKPLSRRYVQIERSPALEMTRTPLPLSRFAVPAWWFRVTGHAMDPEQRYLDRVTALAVEAGESVNPGAHDVVRLKAIRATGSGGSRVWGWWLFPLSLLAFAASFLRRPVRSEPRPRSLPVPLALDPTRTEIVRDWLLSHYQMPDLSLEQLGREIGASEDTASAEVRKAFGEPFKAVLNRIRLTEARRLLAVSDLGIAEIAYKVGYGNIPHFNRVAKEAWGRTPSEERVASRNPPA